MKLIVGLGNPGIRYRNTRHNIGFLVVQGISKRFGICVKKGKYRGMFGKGLIENEHIGICMPQTYMNLSGETVREAIASEKISLKDMLVICDDIDLKFGVMRLREKGSSGGHNGLNSIIHCLGTKEFSRLRIGTAPGGTICDVTDFVLSPFNAKERHMLKEIVEEAIKCVTAWIKDGAAKAMSKFNKKQSL